MDITGERQSTNIEDARTTTLTLTWIATSDFENNTGGFNQDQNGIIIWRNGTTADWSNDYSHIWIEMPGGSTVPGVMGQTPVTPSVDQVRILRKILQSFGRQARSDLQVVSEDGALKDMAEAMMRTAK